jgi:hypothetical protein
MPALHYRHATAWCRQRAAARSYARRPGAEVRPCTSVLAATSRLPAAHSRGSGDPLGVAERQVEHRADVDRAEPAEEDGVAQAQAQRTSQQQQDRQAAQQQDRDGQEDGCGSEVGPLGPRQLDADQHEQHEQRQDQVAVDALVDGVLRPDLVVGDREVVGQAGHEDRQDAVSLQQARDAQRGDGQHEREDERGTLVHVVPPQSGADRPPCDQAGDDTDDDGDRDLLEPVERAAADGVAEDEGEAEEHQRQRQAVVRAGLHRQQLAGPRGQPFLGRLPGDDARGQHRVGR